MKQQLDALEAGAEVIVGTPGRVYDHIRRKSLDLSQGMIGVLDEADEMLNQGFYEEVTRILEKLPDGRQMLLFSATVPPDIDRLIKRFCRDPETLLLSGDEYTVEGIENVIYYTVDSYPKPRNLTFLLELEQPENAIVFCNTRDDTSLVTAVLNRNGYDAEILNGDLPQKDRERVMAKIKRGELDFLVATDIAARGIDISDLGHVINYSLPEDPAVYLHRVGRTGRIGKKGVAISLVSGRELVTLTALEKRFGIKFQERKLPTPEEARRRWTERHVGQVREASRSALSEPMVPLAQALKEQADGDQLLAFLCKYYFTHSRMEEAAKRQASEAAPAEAGEPREERRGRERDRDRDRGRGRDRDRRREERRDDRPRTEAQKPADGSPAEKAAQPPERKDGEPAAEDSRGAKLWCNLGASDKLEDGQIVDTVSQLAGLPPTQIRAVERRATHSYLYVDPASVEQLVQVTGQEREGKKLRIEKPRSRR